MLVVLTFFFSASLSFRLCSVDGLYDFRVSAPMNFLLGLTIFLM